MNEIPEFVLASASPRRAQILSRLGLHFTVAPQDVNESRLAREEIKRHVSRLARDKAMAAAANTDLPSLGADTLVVIDDEALGKPRDEAGGIAMLLQLSGRSHEVMTAVAMV